MRAEPALSAAKGCPRHSGRDARATAAGIVEITTVNRAAVHCGNACDTERRADIRATNRGLAAPAASGGGSLLRLLRTVAWIPIGAAC